ncbi:MAG: hypothetical protein VKJ46_03325 [Leptolyngbyaceae bacterium]|nr:hypothetical protein [Leptolyngbyaceae bacterium]
MFPFNGQTSGSAFNKPLGVAVGISCLVLGTVTPTLALSNSRELANHKITSIQRSSPSQPILTAQLFRRSPYNNRNSQGNRLNVGRTQTMLAAGQTIATHYGGKSQLILQTGETRKLALSLNQDIRNPSGQVVIPADTQIEGEITPVEGGGQFIATRMIINGGAYPFSAKSPTIHDVKDPQQTSAGAIAGDAAIGAAGGIVLGQVLGQRGITLEQVLGGAAAGVVVGNVTAPRAVVLDPGTEVKLQLTENFLI